VEKLLQVIGEARVRCHFHFFGCNFTSSVVDINDHVIVCPRRPFKCPIAYCALDIPLDGVKMHLKRQHNIPLRTQGDEYITSLYKVASRTWYKGITYGEELFVDVSKMNRHTLHTCVLHIGPDIKTSKFKYGVQIGRYNSKKRICSEHAVQNSAQGFDQIVSSGACASFSPQFIQSLPGRSLTLGVKIYVARD
jgi:hypothetical protein